MKNPQYECVYLLWEKICSLFKERNLIQSIKNDFRVYIRSGRIDQVTLHREKNRSWQTATDCIQDESAEVIQSLHELATINLELITNSLNSRIWILTMIIGLFAMFGPIFSIFLYLQPTVDGLLTLILLLLFMLVYLMVNFLFAFFLWRRRQRAMEIYSVIRIELDRRGNTMRGHRPGHST